MPGYVPIHPLAGNQPQNEMFVPTTTGGPANDGQFWPKAMVIDAVDPYFGMGRFIYLKCGETTMNPGRLATIGAGAAFTAIDLPNTANLGYPFFVCRSPMVVNSWGWFQFQGVTPLQSASDVAAGVIAGIAGAGQAGAIANGKELLGVKILGANAFAITKTANTVKGSNLVTVSNVDGLFYGLTVSGTGVPASSEITALDPSGRQFTMSELATAQGTITATFTYTGFLLAYINNPHGQGQVA